MTFQVDSTLFRGPVDLLLYLVRRHEVEVEGIELAKVTDDFLEHLEVLKEISIDSVGEFVRVASTLVEIKSRSILPRNEHEPEEDSEHDPRENLVQRLLLFKRFKDASVLLEESGVQWQNRYARNADDAPAEKVDLAVQPIQEVELWDLVSAFGRVLRDNRPVQPENIFYDETPIHTYMQRIHKKLTEQSSVSFSELFEPGMHKSAMVGVFLAILELTRHHNVLACQNDLHSEITLVPADGFRQLLDTSNIDDYNPHSVNLKSGDPGSMVE